ncbi:MAG: O-antigen ligase family protein [Candidatus Woesearchaeota archaeon]
MIKNFFHKEYTLKEFFVELPIFFIFIYTYILRFFVADPEEFNGNLFSVFIFFVIFIVLLFYLLTEKHELYLLTWISFYFASPIIKLPFTEIGSLGILLGIFLPLMLIKFFDFNDLKNKYFLIIIFFSFYSFIHLSNAELRTIISDYIEVITPLIFFYYAKKKVVNSDLIINYSVLVALFYLPLGIYEFLFKPQWGGLTDWRGYRIFGNLFWHNSYAFYLLPFIVIEYAKIRKNISFNLSLFKKEEFSKPIFKFFKINNKRYVIKHLIIFVIFVFLTFLTFSRNGLLTMILTLIFFESVLNSGFRINKKKILMVVIFLMFLFLYLIFADKLGNRFKPDSIDERTEIWISLLPLIKDNLVFGYGLGSYELFRENVVRSLSSHNYYLFLIFTTGVIGLLFILYFIYLILSQYNYSIQNDTFLDDSNVSNFKYERKFYYGEVGLSILFGILIYSLFGNAAFTHVVSLNAWILLGVCINDS